MSTEKPVGADLLFVRDVMRRTASSEEVARRLVKELGQSRTLGPRRYFCSRLAFESWLASDVAPASGRTHSGKKEASPAKATPRNQEVRHAGGKAS